MKNKWDIESVKAEAEKYEFRRDFRSKSLGAYKAAQRHGWLDIVCAPIKPLWEKKWKYEKIIQEAKKYQYKGDFIKNSPVAYNTAYKNGWLNDVYEILIEKPNKWCFDNVFQEAQKFNTRKEFQIKSQSAYNATRKNGWLDDVCKHMVVKKNIWTLERVRDEAKKYRGRTEFSKKFAGAYQAAKRNSWLNDVCSHMKHANIKWIPELLKLEAQKYNTRKEFQDNSKSAYQSARLQGLLDGICSHMEARLPWTYERVLNEAKKYNTRTAFCIGSYQASVIAKKNGWYENVCAHMDVLWEEKWDFESVLKEAKKYKYRSDFQHGAPGAYGKARMMNWLNECQAHMEDRPRKWTEKTIAEEARKYESRGEFAKGSGSAYKAAIDMGILDNVCEHMKILYNGYNHCVYVIKNERLKKAYVGITSQKYKLRMQQHFSENNPCHSRDIIGFDDTVCKQLTAYVYTPEDVRKFAEQQFVDQFEIDGFHILNERKAIGNVGYSRRKWTRELCHEEALKYKTRWDFQKFSMNEYSAAKNHSWLDDICSHMESPKKSPDYWTKEKCIEEAKKYNSRNEFRINATYPYKIMSINGWIEELCAHIPTIVYKKWEKPNADREIWKRSQEVYNAWVELECCSGFVLSKHFGLKGHKLYSIVSQFEKGWVPIEDKFWLEWVISFSN